MFSPLKKYIIKLVIKAMSKYIHFGCKSFNLAAFVPVKNQRIFTKPSGGFWASAVDAKFGWEQWNDREWFVPCRKDNAFVFVLSEDSKVLHIRNVEILQSLPQIKEASSIIPYWTFLDFEKLAQDYDAIELHLSEDGRLYQALYGWDCDSILIANPNIIQNIKK